MHQRWHILVTSQMCIVTGPNHGHGNQTNKKIEGIFEPKLGVIFAE